MWEKPTYALCCLLCIPLCISDCIPIMVYYGIFHSYLDYIYTGYFFWLNHRFCWLNHLYTVCFPPRNGWSLPETTPRATVNLTQSGRDEGSATTTLRPGSLSHWIPSSLMCRYMGGFRKWWISKVDGLQFIVENPINMMIKGYPHGLETSMYCSGNRRLFHLLVDHSQCRLQQLSGGKQVILPLYLAISHPYLGCWGQAINMDIS